MFFYCTISLALGVVFFCCAISLALGVGFFYCAISLGLGVVFFYYAISLAPVQRRITYGPRAKSFATSPFRFHISLVATLMQARAFLPQACLLVQTDCDFRYAFNV